MVVDLNSIPKAGEYLVTSASDVANIPASAPVGSIVLIVTNSGLTVKMKKSPGSAASNWQEV